MIANKTLFPISLIGFTHSILASFLIEPSLVTDTSSIAEASATIGTATILQFLVAGFFMLLAWKTYPRAKNPEKLTAKEFNLFLMILSLGIVLRILLIPIDSYTSSDTTRYLFDGKLASEGIDPYQTAHDAPELNALKEQWAPPEEHAKYVTLYPPLALSLFALSAGDGVEHAAFTWKLIVTTFSILSLLLVASLLYSMRRQHYLPLVALSPILIFESGIGAHLDTLSAFSVALIAFACWYKKPFLIGIAIAIGTAIKLLPLALLMPIFLLAFFKRKFAFAFITGFSTLFGLLVIYGSTFYLGFKPIGSIGVFFQKWRFGSPVFSVLENQLTNPALLITLATLFLAGLIAISIYLLRSRNQPSSEQFSTLLSAMQYVIALPLILSPVLFPWYLMPLAVLTALHPKPWLLAWILLAPLSYEVLNQFLCCSTWQPAVWPLAVLALSIVFALVFPKLLITIKPIVLPNKNRFI